MKRMIWLAVFLFAMNQTDALSRSTGTVEVLVLDSYTGAPLEDAKVILFRNHVAADSMHTLSDGRAFFTSAPTGTQQEQPGIPGEFYLSENYPNPFIDRTSVEMVLPGAESHTLMVYNILGQHVASKSVSLSAGFYTLNLNLSHLPTGIYFAADGRGRAADDPAHETGSRNSARRPGHVGSSGHPGGPKSDHPQHHTGSQRTGSV